MGNPLSPIVADVYTSALELNLFNNQLQNLTSPPEIHTWIRYVDDIFCIWAGDLSTFTSFLSRLNALEDDLQFTLEIGDQSLNFWDVTVTLSRSSSSAMPTPSFRG